MVRGVACLLGRHRWSSVENRQTQGYDFTCERCGRTRSTYPGDPAFRPAARIDYGPGPSDGGGPG